MCGITGFIDFKNRTPISVLKDMTDSLLHRGPDAGNYYHKQRDNYTVGLGHRRLSIIDLTESGNQPMEYLNGRFWIVFNGEIYNYDEIRQTLLATWSHLAEGSARSGLMLSPSTHAGFAMPARSHRAIMSTASIGRSRWGRSTE